MTRAHPQTASRCLACALVFVVASVSSATAATARDLGTHGPIYAIQEPDMLETITTVLKEKQASGELARLEAQGRQQVLARIRTPLPVPGLRRVQVPKTWHFDPSVRFEEPVLDNNGRVIVPAGTVANPLDVVSVRSTWFLFDGRDPKQVALAKQELDSAKTPLKLILVGGSPLPLADQWKRPVFFDQSGRIVKRLGLTAVPARVRQDGRFLRVEEIPPL